MQSMTPNDYLNLFETSQLTSDGNQLRQLDGVCRAILANQIRYVAVQCAALVPWPLIAAIHSRESALNFTCHLLNGDPLTNRTVHVPSGRPTTGNPPFTWQQGAVEALVERWKPTKWDLPGALEFMERYNGLGYQKHGMNTPYLWSYTDKYSSGKYVMDGRIDPTFIDREPGTVAILKSLASRGVSLDFSGLKTPGQMLN